MERARAPEKRGRLNLLLTLLTGVVIVLATMAHGAGTALPTRAVTLPPGGIGYWLMHDSSTTQVLGDAPNQHRVIRWGSGGLYASTRRTYAVFGFKLRQGSPGRMYNWHTQPNDVGGWTPPCAGGGVSPLAIDYWGDSRGLLMVAEPEDDGCSGGSGSYHFPILSQSETEARRGQWIWLWAEITWGRRDLATKGALKVWLAGQDTPRVNVSGINTHWPQQEMVTFWEGQYHCSTCSGQSDTHVVEITATRFGRSPQEAYDDAPVLYRTYAEPGGGASSAVIDSPDPAGAEVPSSLAWGSPPPPPPPAPKLNVKKVVVGATTAPSAFSFAVSNGGGTHAFEADGQNLLTLPAGTYSVTEPAVSGWTTTYSGCSNVTLSSTQSTVPTCTITNTKQEQAPPAPASNPKLTVKKVVVGATTAPSAFSFAVSNGGGTHAFEADGQNLLTLPAGTYSVTEPAVSGWTTTYSGCSNVVLSSTQSTVPTCTITNTKQEQAPPAPASNPKLTVKKVVVGATTAPSAFSFAVSNGGGTHAFEADGQNLLTLPAGTYSVTEPAVSGWTTTYSGCSNVVLSSTQSTVPTCTITNTKQEQAPPAPASNPKLTVKKVVVGATTAPSAFSFAVSNGGGTHAFEADGQNLLTLPAGTYSVTEPAVSGWTTTYSGCSNVTLSSTQSTIPTCTITNTKQEAPAPPPADATPPTAPGSVKAKETKPKKVELSWTASTDNVGVKAYGVYRDGVLTSTQTTLSATLEDLECGTSYTLAVDAQDHAGNRSEKTSTVLSTGACRPAAPEEPTDDERGKPEKPDHPDKPDHPVKPTHPEGQETLDSGEGSAAPRPAPKPTSEPVGSPQTAAGRSIGAHDRRLPGSLLSYGRPLWPLLPVWNPEPVDVFGWLASSVYVERGEARPASRPLVGPDGRIVERLETVRHHGEQGRIDLMSLGLRPWVSDAYDLISVRWDGRRFFTRRALKLHLDWSGESYNTWVRQHRKAFQRLPE